MQCGRTPLLLPEKDTPHSKAQPRQPPLDNSGAVLVHLDRSTGFNSDFVIVGVERSGQIDDGAEFPNEEIAVARHLFDASNHFGAVVAVCDRQSRRRRTCK